MITQSDVKDLRKTFKTEVTERLGEWVGRLSTLADEVAYNEAGASIDLSSIGAEERKFGSVP